jgi:putative ABC transport system ATP-binding protein
MLLCSGGLLRPSSGQVKIVETDPYELTSDARAKLRAETIGFVFQQFHLVPFLSVRDNILAPAMALGTSILAEVAARADELIEHFGLTSRRDHTPGALSSGERQRTALARALLNKPRLILADEPTGNLDSENGERVLTHLREFADSGGGVLLVTHDEQAISKADNTVRLQDGRVVTEAT